jgi:hypothetical protein
MRNNKKAKGIIQKKLRWMKIPRSFFTFWTCYNKVKEGESREKTTHWHTGFWVYDGKQLLIHRQNPISAHAQRPGEVLFYVPSQAVWKESDDFHV